MSLQRTNALVSLLARVEHTRPVPVVDLFLTDLNHWVVTGGPLLKHVPRVLKDHGQAGLKARPNRLFLIPSGPQHLGLVPLELLLEDRFKLRVTLSSSLAFLVLSYSHVLFKSHKALLLLHRVLIP